MQQQSKYQNNNANPVILSEGDYQLLTKLVKHTNDAGSGMSLSYELNRAIVVNKAAFPAHTIALNSKVSVCDEETGTEKKFMLVMPARADIKKGLVSVLSPIGTALIGFRKGEHVEWQMPGGMKKFRITDVDNSALK